MVQICNDVTVKTLGNEMSFFECCVNAIWALFARVEVPHPLILNAILIFSSLFKNSNYDDTGYFCV